MEYNKLKERAKACGVTLGLILTLSAVSHAGLAYWKRGGKMKKATALKIERVLKSYESLYQKHIKSLQNSKGKE